MVRLESQRSHRLSAKATADAPVSVFNPWVKPGPKAHAYLLFGFSLARANARMLINADSKRRSARNSVRLSPSVYLCGGCARVKLALYGSSIYV